MFRTALTLSLLALSTAPALAQTEDAAETELDCRATPGGVECAISMPGAAEAERDGDPEARTSGAAEPMTEPGEAEVEAEAPVLYCMAQDAEGNPIANSTVSANTGVAVFNTLTEDDLETVADVVCREEGVLLEEGPDGSEGGVEEVSPEDEGTATL